VVRFEQRHFLKVPSSLHTGHASIRSNQKSQLLGDCPEIAFQPSRALQLLHWMDMDSQIIEIAPKHTPPKTKRINGLSLTLVNPIKKETAAANPIMKKSQIFQN